MTDSLVQEIKQKIDLVELVRSYLSLHPAGRNFKALCPFHNEKTPSFIVSPDRQIWHCFGCNSGGDAIKFVMQYENLEFYEALRILAERAGIRFEGYNLREQKELQTLYSANEKAKEFFKRQLGKNQKASEYLKKRGLNQETIEVFELGFAPGGDSLVLDLVNAGFNVTELLRAGLILKTESGMHRDRFQQRIMFPIKNAFGKIAGFNGRILPEKESGDMPKYLNTSDTPIFKKSKILYGFSESKGEILRSRSAFLVEGQIDFLMTWQSGIHNVVAVSGTALSNEHLNRLRRSADTIFVSFDKDEAGLKALERTLDLAAPLDFNIKVVDLGRFKDPAEAAVSDPAFLEQAFQNSRFAFSYLFDIFLSQERNKDFSDKKRNIRYLLKRISGLQSPLEQSQWLKDLSVRAGIEERILNLEMASLRASSAGKSGEPSSVLPEAKGKEGRIHLIAKRLIALALMKPDFFKFLREQAEYFPPVFKDVLSKEQSGGAAELIKMESSLLDELSLRGAHEFSDLKEEDAEKEFGDLSRQLKLEHLRKKSLDIRNELSKAQQKGEVEALNLCLRHLQEVTNEIHSIQKI